MALTITSVGSSPEYPGHARFTVKASARTGSSPTWQLSHFGRYDPYDISRFQIACISSCTRSTAMR